MSKREQYEIPAGLKEAKEGFAEWRGSHTGRKAIPAVLWKLASTLAAEHGLFRTAQALRLDYTKLKRQMHVVTPMARTSSAPPAFVELVGPHSCDCIIDSGRPPRPNAHRMERLDAAGPGESQPNAVGARRVIQIAPQIRILVAVEPIDARKGIDSLAQLCREKLASDPFSGCLFIFRSRRGTAIKLLTYDGADGW